MNLTPAPATTPRTPAAQPGPANCPPIPGQPAAAQRTGGAPELGVVAVLGYN